MDHIQNLNYKTALHEIQLIFWSEYCKLTTVSSVKVLQIPRFLRPEYCKSHCFLDKSTANPTVSWIRVLQISLFLWSENCKSHCFFGQSTANSTVSLVRELQIPLFFRSEYCKSHCLLGQSYEFYSSEIVVISSTWL